MKIKNQNSALISISVFIGLAFAFAVLLIAASGFQEAFAQYVLISLGSAIFSAGLVVFLLHLVGR